MGIIERPMDYFLGIALMALVLGVGFFFLLSNKDTVIRIISIISGSLGFG
ncbi:MAG: hypothetical protein HYW26_03145 [Candidatus Aenigmarchaeota archaeon]|nr:hypothetical protein [Candidatus Aenigmarchaeota archaeon]